MITTTSSRFDLSTPPEDTIVAANIDKFNAHGPEPAVIEKRASENLEQEDDNEGLTEDHKASIQVNSNSLTLQDPVVSNSLQTVKVETSPSPALIQNTCSSNEPNKSDSLVKEAEETDAKSEEISNAIDPIKNELGGDDKSHQLENDSDQAQTNDPEKQEASPTTGILETSTTQTQNINIDNIKTEYIAEGSKDNNVQVQMTSVHDDSKSETLPDVVAKDQIYREPKIPESETIKHGCLVLAKVEGFPPWPGVILDEGKIPVSILEEKHHSSGDKNLFVGKFIGHSSYFWLPEKKLFLTTKDKLKAKLKTKGLKSKSSLRNAYRLASTLYIPDFIAKFEGEFEEDNVTDDDPADSSVKSTSASSRLRKNISKAKTERTGKISEILNTSDDSDSAKHSQKVTESESLEKRNIQAKRPLFQEHSEGNGHAEKYQKLAPPNFKAPIRVVSPLSNTESPTNSPYTDEGYAKKRISIVKYIRHRIQKGFFNEKAEPEFTRVSEALGELEDLREIEPYVFRETKIQKVIYAVLRLDHIPEDSTFQFRKRMINILEKWSLEQLNFIEKQLS